MGQSRETQSTTTSKCLSCKHYKTMVQSFQRDLPSTQGGVRITTRYHKTAICEKGFYDNHTARDLKEDQIDDNIAPLVTKCDCYTNKSIESKTFLND